MAPRKNPTTVGNANINPLSIACTMYAQLNTEAQDGTMRLFSGFADFDENEVVEPSKFWSMASIPRKPIPINEGEANEYNLELYEIGIEGYDGTVSLCLNKAYDQCQEHNVELWVNGHFNPDLMVHKLAGHSDSKKKYLNRLELYFA